MRPKKDSFRPRVCIIEVVLVLERACIIAWGQQSDLGTVDNGGGGIHGIYAVHTESNYGVEGSRTM